MAGGAAGRGPADDARTDARPYPLQGPGRHRLGQAGRVAGPCGAEFARPPGIVPGCPALRLGAAAPAGPPARPRHLGLPGAGPPRQGHSAAGQAVHAGAHRQGLLGGGDRRARGRVRGGRSAAAQADRQGRLAHRLRSGRAGGGDRVAGVGPGRRPGLDRMRAAHRAHPPDPRAYEGAGLPGARRPLLRSRPRDHGAAAPAFAPAGHPASVGRQAPDSGRGAAAFAHDRGAGRLRLDSGGGYGLS
ncbi:hypothetical protein MTBUT4_130029 [Magnetospirillum sp. UT-4]|nr:hypothetical protein MTBUT4_130029 [Magnetospirillum sp. UT-4]